MKKVLLLVALIVYFNAFAQTEGYHGDVEFQIAGDNLIIFPADGISAIMPDYGYGTESAPWAQYKDQIKKIIISPSVLNISDYAFYFFQKLESIELHGNLQGIGQAAFQVCDNLKSITIPDGIDRILPATFSGCSNLTSVKLPLGLQTIEFQAFAGCYRLPHIELPPAVGRIQNGAFTNCSSLKKIVCLAPMPPNVHENAFDGIMPNTVTLVVVNGFEEMYEGTEIWGRFNLKKMFEIDNEGILLKCNATRDSIVIPNRIGAEDIIRIGMNAFENTDNLISVAISNTIRSIGEAAFKGCEKLETVLFYEDDEYMQTMSVSGLQNIEANAFQNCISLKSVEIPASVASIGDHCFGNCTNLEDITVYWDNPVSVTDEVFENIDKSAVTLIVPNGTTANYLANNVWKEFDIQENNTSSTIAVESKNLSYSIENNLLHLTETPGNANIALFNIAGKLLYQGKDQSILLPGKGIYIISIDAQQFKILNK